MYATQHGNRATEKKEPTPEPAATPRPRPAHRHWTLYKQLTHARTLAEHSIQPYTEAAYVEGMLQDWTKYESEVLEGHTGPPDTTSCTTWDNIVPAVDIGALATVPRSKTAQGPTTRLGTTTTPPSRMPSWPTTAGPLSEASTSTPRRLTHASGTLCDHSAGVLPARRCNHRGAQHDQPSANSATTDTGARHTPQPNKTINAGATRTRAPTRRAQPTSLQKDRAPKRHHYRPTTRQAPHLASNRRQLPTTTKGGTTKGAQQQHGNYRRAPSIGRKSSQE